MIDTAAAYMNDEAVGRADKKSGLPREDILVTTRLWIQDAGYEITQNAFEKSSAKLRPHSGQIQVGLPGSIPVPGALCGRQKQHVQK
jgi:hypothetical protein